jgi:Calcineurin-like phosphoesterase
MSFVVWDLYVKNIVSEESSPKTDTKSYNNNLDSTATYISGKTLDQLLEGQAGSTLLGRPKNNSITINVLATPHMEAYFEYGTKPGSYTHRTSSTTSISGEPIEVEISDLLPDTEYYYRTNYKKAGETNYQKGPEHSFHTQRLIGSSFTFNVQADPHMDGHSEAEVYKLTLQNEAADNADFVIDLGDTFMTEKFAKNEDEVIKRYIEQRNYLDMVGSSTPLFLANGNHEGEFGWLFNSNNTDNDAYWAIKARKTYYPNPFPDDFYSGSATQDPIAGFHENYYSWEWGDALFIVLDPYTYSSEFRKQTGDMWDSTIGNDQYTWFKKSWKTARVNTNLFLYITC